MVLPLCSLLHFCFAVYVDQIIEQRICDHVDQCYKKYFNCELDEPISGDGLSGERNE